MMSKYNEFIILTLGAAMEMLLDGMDYCNGEMNGGINRRVSGGQGEEWRC